MGNFDLEVLKRIGKFSSELKVSVLKRIAEGVSVLSVIEFVEGEILKANFFPAFPCTICINEQAAHFTIFDEEIVFKLGDVVKVDFGVVESGFIVDTAFTCEVGTNRYEKLLSANKKALEEELKFVQSGVSVCDIGRVAENIAKENGFNTIHNLSGHEIARYDLHAGLNVPNYDNGDKAGVGQEMMLAIEPFFSCGSPMIKTAGNSNILHLHSKKPVRDFIAKQVLDYIVENFPDLPFSKRWLLKKFEKRKVLYALNVLKLNKIVFEYELLVSEDGSIISQFEDTVLFEAGKKFVLTN